MPKSKSIRVVVDTNVWISYLIGKRLQLLTTLLADRRVTLVISKGLLNEIELVTRRPKFRKYFSLERVNELVKLMRVIGDEYELSETNIFARDPKDSFLLTLASTSKADYLVTGDLDLLELKRLGKTIIISVGDFERAITKIKPD
jgi:uncharacterized protein